MIDRMRTVARALFVAEARDNAWWEWKRRLGREPPLPARPMRKVLVLCHGNLCRSPFAEALLRRRRPDLAVSSGGLGAREGDAADPTALRIAREFGVDLGGHRSRRATREAIREADLLLVMEGAQARAAAELAPEAAHRIRLLGDYLDGAPHRLEDPWGRSDGLFREVFSRIDRATERLAGRIEEEPVLAPTGVGAHGGRSEGTA